jgi:type VI protein secretion system component Hcp
VKEAGMNRLLQLAVVAAMAAPAAAAASVLDIPASQGRPAIHMELASYVYTPARGGEDASSRSARDGGFRSLTVTAPLNGDTPRLVEAAARGQHFPSAVITDTRDSRTLKITMSDVMVSSARSSSDGDRPGESLTLSFTGVKIEESGGVRPRSWESAPTRPEKPSPF